MNRFVPPSMHASIATLALLIAVVGCGPERSPTPAPPAEPAHAAAPAAPPVNSIERIASTVSAADRTQSETRVAALLARIETNPPTPRVLFSVPVSNCDRYVGQGGAYEDCFLMQGLFYAYEGGDPWGLGNLFVDAAGRFWQTDQALGRVVAFDLKGKRLHIVSLVGPNSGVTNVWHVTDDEVRIEPYEDSPKIASIARYSLDGTFRGSAPIDTNASWWSLTRLPGEQNRFVSFRSVSNYRVVDAKYTGNRVTFSAPSELRSGGHRYGFVCIENSGTLVIDDYATAVPGCGGLRYVGADGGVVLDMYPDRSTFPAALQYDSHAKLAGAALGAVAKETLSQGSVGPVAIGPDGKAYSYIARKRRVDFVEVPFVAP